MKNIPKTIQIFLPDGNARSIRIAEITSRTIQAIQVPRSKVAEAGSREETKNVGVYFLFGESEKTGQAMVYIGEAEDCLNRIYQHNRKKGFWDTVVIITSKTNSFTKSHVKYLEWYCHQQADDSGRYLLENSTIPSKPFISEMMEADLMDNYETIKVLLSTLGYPILEKVVKTKKPSDLLYISGRGIKANGQYLEDGFVVYKDSQCSKNSVPSLQNYALNARRMVIEEGVVKIEGNTYIFTRDYIFSSPSMAGSVVLGRSTNGWTKWKDINGKTLDELKRH